MFGPVARFFSYLVKISGFGKPLRWLFDATIYRLWLKLKILAFQGSMRRLQGDGLQSSKEEVLAALSLLAPTSAIANPVRIGGAEDGGYVVPLEIFEASALFSPGVAQSSMFEIEFARRGIPCYLADASVKGPTQSHELFNFRPLFIGASDLGQFITMRTWIESSVQKTTGLALQMDIEGAEWEILAQGDWLPNFRFLVIEFHNLEGFWNAAKLPLMREALEKVLQTFECVLTVTNNFSPMMRYQGIDIPSTVEATFVAKGDQSLASLQFIERGSSLLRKNNPRLPAIGLGHISQSGR